MAEQATDTVGNGGAVTGTDTAGALAHGPTHMPHNPGRPISWTGTSVVIVGFIVGGWGFLPPIANPSVNWVVVWVGGIIAAIGLLILLFSKTMSTDWY